jgi:hypothetical protein
MINVAKIRADVEASPGELIGISKAQLAELLDETERGQRAQRELRNVKTIAAVAGIMEMPG